MGRKSAPALVLVGGFLGAGKTTLILHAARLLTSNGYRVAVITNDQDSGLVDTKFSEARGFGTREVAGGCFCCRFSDLIQAADQLGAYQPGIIFAEPVGSCIDLSATILQPLKAYHRHAYRVAPLTVLFDPDLANRVFANQADDDTSYLFRHQLLEADLVCAAKSDLHVQPPPMIPVDFHVSARTGDGIEAWLKEVLSGRRVAGARVLDVDYNRYAEAEAALGWLNLHARVRLRAPLSPAAVAGPLLDGIDESLTNENIRIAHLKVFDQSRSGYIKAGICANRESPVPDGDLLAGPARDHELVINLRALAEPSSLESIVRKELSRIDACIRVQHAGAFRPAPPRPEHRFKTPLESPG